jgi:hypothetical protein
MCMVYACLYVCLYVCIYACMHVCVHHCMYVKSRVCEFMCVRCTHACMYVCVYEFMHAHSSLVCRNICMESYEGEREKIVFQIPVKKFSQNLGTNIPRMHA